MATITIPLDTETARIYTEAPVEEQKKLRLLLSLWLRDYAVTPTPLTALMDRIADKARARGLTEEILNSLLNAD